MSNEIKDLHTISPSQALSYLNVCLSNHIVPMLWGPAGIGKTQLAYKVAELAKLKLIDIRLTTTEPQDFNGYPDNRGEKATYKEFDTFPIEGDKIPEGYKGWLVLVDELPSVNQTLQASAYKFLLERGVGQKKLHPNVHVMAAGNDVNHDAISYGMNDASGTRVAHFYLRADVKDWLTWAYSVGIDHRITSFINYNHDHLYAPQRKGENEYTFACPRTYERANVFIQDEPNELKSMFYMPLLASVLGRGMAQDFLMFTQVYKDLVSFEDILSMPNSARMPTTGSGKHAITGVLASHVNADNISKVTPYIERLDYEFRTLLIRDLAQRNREIMHNADYRKIQAQLVLEATPG